MPHRKPWRQDDFLQYLKDNPSAESAINKLVAPNCSHGRLILLLRAASNPNRRPTWNHFVREWVPSQRQAMEVAEILNLASTKLRQFACSPFGASALVFHETLESARRREQGAFYGEAVELGVQNEPEDPGALADAIERQARRLLQWSHSSVAAVAPRLLSFRTVWKHLPIVLVARVVRRWKGQVPWGDLAYALEAVAAGYGIIADISPDALRKEHNGFMRSNAGKAFQKSGAVDAVLQIFVLLSA